MNNNDNVTVGEIVGCFNKVLEDHIDVLVKLVRQGNVEDAKKYLSDTIEKVWANIRQIKSWASIPKLRNGG